MATRNSTGASRAKRAGARASTPKNLAAAGMHLGQLQDDLVGARKATTAAIALAEMLQYGVEHKLETAISNPDVDGHGFLKAMLDELAGHLEGAEIEATEIECQIGALGAFDGDALADRAGASHG